MQDITHPFRIATNQCSRDLQADLHQVDEPAQLFDDLVALLCKIVRPDDLPELYAALTACTTKHKVPHLSQSPLLLVFANAVGKHRRFLRNVLDHGLLALQRSCRTRALWAR